MFTLPVPWICFGSYEFPVEIAANDDKIKFFGKGGTAFIDGPQFD